MTEKDVQALRECAAFGLHPIAEPEVLGNAGHHTEEAFTPEDLAIGSALAWFLGTMWTEDADYFYNRRTSCDEWARVARALRIFGLRIADK